MKTRLEVITRALRRIRIVAMDEAATTDQENVAGDALDALVLELDRSHDLHIGNSTQFEDDIFLPLAYLLAAEIAPDFSVQSPEPRSRALMRLRSVLDPNDYIAPAKAVYY